MTEKMTAPNAPHPASRTAHRGSRIPDPESRIPDPASRIADPASQTEVVRALQERIRQLEGGRATGRANLSGGATALDRLFPPQGPAQGTLVEWFESGPGSGAGLLALLAARQVCHQGGVLVIVDRRRIFYPPAAHSWGIDPAAMIVVCPGNDQEEHWVLDQVLRSGCQAAVLAWPERLDSRTFRRLQLAAEAGRGVGLLVRRQEARSEPSWADTRWLIHPQPSRTGWRLTAELLRWRGGAIGGRRETWRVELQIDPQTGIVHEADPLHLATELADPAPYEREARA